MLSQLANVDMKIAQRVANGLGHTDSIVAAASSAKTRTDLKPSAALSILRKAKPTMKGRMIGILVADGTDGALVTALKASAKSNGATLKVIAPKVGGAKAADGSLIVADLQLAGGPSVLFDAVVLAVSPEGAQQLTMMTAAVGFVSDAFSHLKVIGHTAEAAPLLQKAGVVADQGVIVMQSNNSADDFLATASKGRIWDREPKVRPVL
jgi:catalase